jgi:hypothetical protein
MSVQFNQQDGSNAQPNVRQPRFRNALEAWDKHLLVPCWKPLAGTFGIPMTAERQVHEPGLLPYVVQLCNAFTDCSDPYDARPDMLSRFQPGCIYTPDDIEAISHVLVASAVNLHTIGAVSISLKRLPGKIPTPDRNDARLTFAQRIFCLATLVKHYKEKAVPLMQLVLHEDFLVGIWDMLRQTDFPQRQMARPQEREAWHAHLSSLGGQAQLGVGNPGAQAQGFGNGKHKTFFLVLLFPLHLRLTCAICSGSAPQSRSAISCSSPTTRKPG